MNNMTAAGLMQQIAEYEFLLADLNLYLDTHPSDTRALGDYNSYAAQLRTLKDKYIREYGPLENFGNSINFNGWQYNDRPWPWDIV
ncbi:MAG: spore coat protein CotJB [Eubacteriales bacterium]|nr:spore coat protein CotJB [Eubacteriales bacterium]